LLTLSKEKKMQLNKIIGLAIATMLLNIGALSDAYAASIDVKCETRSNRSKISVDARGLANGIYKARVRSGTALRWAKAYKRPSAGEVEFDFDSNRNDVLQGATYIPPTFIKNNTAIGDLFRRNSNGTLRRIGSVSETCRRK
jgi:hypothetical protein